MDGPGRPSPETDSKRPRYASSHWRSIPPGGGAGGLGKGGAVTERGRCDTSGTCAATPFVSRTRQRHFPPGESLPLVVPLPDCYRLSSVSGGKRSHPCSRLHARTCTTIVLRACPSREPPRARTTRVPRSIYRGILSSDRCIELYPSRRREPRGRCRSDPRVPSAAGSPRAQACPEGRAVHNVIPATSPRPGVVNAGA